MEVHNKSNYNQFEKIEIKQEPSVDFLLTLPTLTEQLIEPKKENGDAKKPIIRLKKFDTKCIVNAKMFEKFFTCQTCDFFSRGSNNMRRHLQRHHNTAKKAKTVRFLGKHRCDLCSVTTKYKYNMKVHVIMHMKIKPFGCKDCGKTFSREPHLQFHTKNKKTVYKCKFCDITFKCRILEQKHLKDKHDNKVHCKICLESFETRYKLNIHKRRHLKVICEVCSRELSSKENLKYHQISSKHGKFALKSDEKKFSCNQCDKVYLMKKQLHEHQRNTHVEQKFLTCKICGKIYANRDSLRYHMAIHRYRKMFECDLCGKTYPRKKSLYYHLKNIHKDQDVFCTLCPKKFNKIDDLFQHRKQHVKTGIKKCPEYPECSYEAMRANTLKSHIKLKHKTILS